MLFRLFQVFLAYVFLSGKLADPDPLPPTTNFFFETFPKRVYKQAQESVAAAMSLNSVSHSNYCLNDFKLQLATCNLQLQPATCKM